MANAFLPVSWGKSWPLGLEPLLQRALNFGVCVCERGKGLFGQALAEMREGATVASVAWPTLGLQGSRLPGLAV